MQPAYGGATYGGGYGQGGNAFAFGTPNPDVTSLQSSSPNSISQTTAAANKPVIQVGRVSIRLGGYFDTTALYRSRNLTSGTSSPFNSIPFSNSPNAHTDEFRMTAQPSRLGMLVDGNLGGRQLAYGYAEFDLNAAATTSNSNQTNSYSPRVRLVYASYDNYANGWHMLLGQNWSLAVATKYGVMPRREGSDSFQENIPIVIDAQYLPGWVYTRQPQLRVAKSFANGAVSLAGSLEAPQETYSFAGATTSTTVPNLTLPAYARMPAEALSFNNLGGSYLNSTASYSYDTAPDMIVKAAVDPGFGHYEAYGLGRWFKTHTSTLGAGSDHVVFGGGVGGSASIPIIPKYVDLVGDVLGGYGVGRYGSGQLPDASFKANGDPAPLPEIIGMAGIVAHPTKAIDAYTYVGTEQIGRSTYAVSTTAGKVTTTTGYGYGTGYANTTGCDIELGATCNAQTRALSDVSVGAWWRFLHGNYGTVQAGAEYSYVKRVAFHGSTPGHVSTDDNIIFFSFRYLPFQ